MIDEQRKQKQTDALLLEEAKSKIRMKEIREELKAKQETKSPLDLLIERANAAKAAEGLGDKELYNNILSMKPSGDAASSTQPQPRVAPQGIPQTKFGAVQPQEVQQSLARPEDLIPTKFKPGSFGDISPTEYVSKQSVISEKILSESTKASGKQLETLLKTTGNLSRVENAFSGLVAQAKRAVNEQGGFGAKAAVSARALRIGQRLGFGEEAPLEKQFGGLAGHDAQRQETILALSPILTGQNRILRSALAMLKKTVPDLPIMGTTEAEYSENIRQSMKNSFKLSLGIARGLLPPYTIAKLTQTATDDQITQFLTDIVARTRFTQEDEKSFNDLFQRVIKTPATEPVGLFQPGERQFGRFQGTSSGVSVDTTGQASSVDSEIEAINKQLDKLGGR